MTSKKEKKDWLSITSLVLSIVWALLCLSIIWAFIWLPAVILWLIFGIIALVKKQKKWMAIAGVIISSLVIVVSIIVISIWVMFFRKNADVLIDPIKEFSQIIKEDPELAELMNKKEFANEFEYEFKNRMIEKFWDDAEMESREDIKTQIPSIFEEMKNLMFELKEKHQD